MPDDQHSYLHDIPNNFEYSKLFKYADEFYKKNEDYCHMIILWDAMSI